MKNIERLPFPHLIKELVDYEPPNSMNTRQTYRKHSSEWMGFSIETINGKRYYVKDKFRIRIQAWQPDLSYDQMHMMISELIKEGAQITLDFFYNDTKPFVSIWDGKQRYDGEHEDIRTAFRLACTEFKTAK